MVGQWKPKIKMDEGIFYKPEKLSNSANHSLKTINEPGDNFSKVNYLEILKYFIQISKINCFYLQKICK